MRFVVPLLVLVAQAAMAWSPAFAEEGPAVLVTDLDPSSRVPDVGTSGIRFGDRFYFTGGSEISGYEIFSTDGTSEGTLLEADVCQGRCASTYLFQPVEFRGALFWSACERGGCQLWKLEEAVGGLATRAIYDAGGGDGNYVVGGILDLTAWKDALFFTTTDGELRRTDGDGPGTVLARIPGLRRLDSFLPSPDTLYFIAYGNDGGVIDPPIAPPPQLWRTDGTVAGTYPLWDLGHSNFSLPVVVGDRLVFVGEDEKGQDRLLVSDGTGVENLFEPRLFTSRVELLQAIDDELYLAVDHPGSGEVWRTNTTASGTRRVGDAGGDSTAIVSIAFQGELYFFNYRGDPSLLLRVSRDGERTVPVYDFPDDILSFDVSAGVLYVTTWNGTGRFTLWRLRNADDAVSKVFSSVRYFEFLAQLRGDPVVRLHTSDREGTLVRVSSLGKTVPLLGMEGASGDPRELVAVGSSLFFQTGGPEEGEVELWRLAGGDVHAHFVETLEGFFHVLTLGDRLVVFEPASIHSVDAGGHFELNFVPRHGDRIYVEAAFPFADGILFLTFNEFPPRLSLWRLGADPRVAFEVLPSFADGGVSVSGASLDDALLLFLDSEIWRTDGTAAGTTRVIDLEPTCPYCTFRNPVRAGSYVYFTDLSLYDPRQRRLLRTDGTFEGTQVLLELHGGESPIEGWPGPPPTPVRLTAAGERLFFVVADSSIGQIPIPFEPQLPMGSELWTSDGTAGGTRLVRDIWPGRSSSNPQELIELPDGRLLFTADDGVAGRELWVSDGTAEGTALLHDLRPGPPPSQPHHLRRVGDAIVFAAGGAELWASDLDASRPRRIEDIAPGPLGSDPKEFTVVGDRVYFNAGQPDSGFELWTADLSAFSSPPPPPPPPPTCVECVLDGRFAVTVEWKNHDGSRQGRGTPIPVSGETVAFWFFHDSNVELLVKVLDGRQINGNFWVFYGALTDVEYTVRVEDRETGEVRSYHNPAGRLCGLNDTGAFDAARLSPEKTTPSCVPGPATLCLLDGRFRVETTWQTRTGAAGTGRARPATRETGYFWFFSEDNVEVVVKMLDGRAINGHFWFFAAGLTDVEYHVTVTDTMTGAVYVHESPAGALCGVGDTGALSD